MGMKKYESELEKRLPMLLKRSIDIAGSFCAIIILSPFLIGIAATIKLQGDGRILYQRHVVGRNGKTFNAFKFRTMMENADTFLDADSELKEEFENNFKLKNDPRVTRIGKVLRKLSMDEFPQLFNIFIGQMSLVGPRMVTPEELERYGKFKSERIKIRPGMSGYWQVSGRQEIDYNERIKMDQFYMYRWNIWMDLWIILKTIQKVLKMEGAY
jgi:undecaprenyl-phosphate galactose phosphotransferase